MVSIIRTSDVAMHTRTADTTSSLSLIRSLKNDVAFFGRGALILVFLMASCFSKALATAGTTMIGI